MHFIHPHTSSSISQIMSSPDDNTPPTLPQLKLSKVETLSPPPSIGYDDHYHASVRFQHFLFEAQKNLHCLRETIGGQHVTETFAHSQSITFSIEEMDHVMRFMTKDNLSLFPTCDVDLRLGNEIDRILQSCMDAWFGLNPVEMTPEVVPEDSQNPTTEESPKDIFTNIDSDHSKKMSP